MTNMALPHQAAQASEMLGVCAGACGFAILSVDDRACLCWCAEVGRDCSMMREAVR